MGKGQELYKRAKKLIPGGTMLFSKRPEFFLPEQWPAYFSKAKGSKVWDLDGNEYLDMSIMGIGTNTLGYGNDNVDQAVQNAVIKGNMSTFSAPEEVELAEKLVDLHPWADMVRFARSGGEANAIAIRIARAASGRDKVAICGYHGWHDWYLSANLGKTDDLGNHLLPGLDPAGVPKHLEGTVFAFNYNKIEELKSIIADNPDLGVIKMEVSRNVGPEKGFLEEVRNLATQHGIVLVFDECTSGFRQTFGGLHKLYGIEPDMCMFGKTLGNGYAVTAVVGRREVMEAAQSTFISSTFWTERIGSVAALATLEEMERQNSWEVITKKGAAIKKRWNELATACGLSINVFGLDALAIFVIDSPEFLAYKTYITQEMLKKGILAGNSIYVATTHSTADIDRYFEEIEPIWRFLGECEKGHHDVKGFLNGPICHGGFKRLN